MNQADDRSLLKGKDAELLGTLTLLKIDKIIRKFSKGRNFRTLMELKV